ncbi:tetratricopeptide repeat protein [Thermanaerothrix sp. 4228-RoL]|uniref:Tetratricopeptide repeat protein n=1 Tax=Thermanaerothrix solaris TaxID=3058434 RepID=A0ABU3NSW2_9CHLR|nr:tetratricopeptide repeat protein [Thermanaerothrix sp. 4228-RoL]MDT8899298.1 tetratricopeptide repeat protein [Thermanaerothrix sp. 4228-RoL]
MYLRGSRFNLNRRRRRSNPVRVVVLMILVGAALYFNQFVVPQTPPLFVPTPTPTRAPESYAQEAEQLVSQGKFLPAIQLYREALLVDPRNPAYHLALARLYIYTKNYQQALETAGNALLQNPNNAQALALRGYALGLMGDYLQAEAALNQAIELDPNNPVPYAYLAEVLGLKVQNGEGDLVTLNRAIDLSRKAQSLGPDLLETHRARGLVLELTANYADAAREFEAAIAQNKYIADLYLALGRNYRAIPDYPKAIQAFGNAIPLMPTDPLPYMYLSKTYLATGELTRALQYAEQALSHAPTDPYLYGNLGVIYYRTRDYVRAIQYLRIAVRGGTSEDGQAVQGLALDYYPISEYYYTYGLALARTGECEEAVQIARALLQGVSNEDVAVSNAQEIINICGGQVSGAAAPSPSATP